MPHDTKPDELVPFPVEVTVNGVKVAVTLMLKPGTTVTREQEPEPPKSAAQVTPNFCARRLLRVDDDLTEGCCAPMATERGRRFGSHQVGRTHASAK